MLNLVYKYLTKWFWNARIAFALIRYAATAAIAFEALLFARLIGPEYFGNYVIVIQAVGFLALVGAGSGAGYVMQYFKQETENHEFEANYIFGSMVQYFSGGVVLLLLSSFSKSYLSISSLLLLLQIPYYVSEPILRVRNKYILSAFGRASGSIATIILTFVFLLSNKISLSSIPRISLNLAMTLMIIGNIVGYFTYYLVLVFGNHVQLSNLKLWVRHRRSTNLLLYWKNIILPSGSYVFSSISFTAFTYVDRFFIEKNYPSSDLSIYSLGWQITQSVLLLLTSLNTISGIRIGESQSNDPLMIIAVAERQLKISLLAGAFCFSVASILSYLLSITLYKDYSNLVTTTVILCLGYLSCGIIGAITMLLFFERKYGKIAVVYTLILFADIIGNLLSQWYKLPYIYPISFSAILMIIANIWMWVLFKKTSFKLLNSSQRTNNLPVD